MMCCSSTFIVLMRRCCWKAALAWARLAHTSQFPVADRPQGRPGAATHQLIDQLLASADMAAIALPVAAFRPARMFEARADYLAQRQVARDARGLICTAASVVIDQRLKGEYNGAMARDVIVFDEADQLPNMTALQSDCVIDAALLQGQPLQVALERISTTRSHTVEAAKSRCAGDAGDTDRAGGLCVSGAGW